MAAAVTDALRSKAAPKNNPALCAAKDERIWTKRMPRKEEVVPPRRGYATPR